MTGQEFDAFCKQRLVLATRGAYAYIALDSAARRRMPSDPFSDAATSASFAPSASVRTLAP